MAIIDMIVKVFNKGMRRWCTDPDSKEICGCGVFLGRSDNLDNMCRQLVQSYQCTAARRAMLHTHPRLQIEGEEAESVRRLSIFRITV